MKMQMLVLILMSIVSLSCSPLEMGKTIWGSSTRALEKARDQAITKTIDKPYWDAVRLSFDIIKEQGWTIFKRDEVGGYVVLMGIQGAVNTTEVGIFFDEISSSQTRIEVASLSTHAKRLVAKPLFLEMDMALGLIPKEQLLKNNETNLIEENKK